MRESLERTFRAREWWSHKLAAILGLGYGTVLFAGGELLAAVPALALGTAALIPGAAFVSVLNDYTDLELDRAAGKPNRLAGRPRGFGRRALAVTLALGAAAAVAVGVVSGWALAFYLPAWLAFTAYSVSPLRLKERGWLGAAADAAGAHLFPQLVVVILAFAGADAAIDWGWVGLVGAWAFAYGLRGAIWHQSSDAVADRASGAATLVAARPRAALIASRWVVFPLELATLAVILILIGSTLAFVALALYLALELARVRLWQVEIVIGGEAGRYRILMHEYYAIALPLALLAAATIADPINAVVLAIHLVLFWSAIGRAGLDATRAVAQLATVPIAYARRKAPTRLKHALRTLGRRLRR